MDIQLFPPEKIQSFVICTARVAALLGAAPVFNSNTSPMQVRAGLVLFISLTLFPVLEPYIPQQPSEISSLALLVTNEVLLGGILGLIARFIFTAAEFGGTVVGYQMGFAAANVFDPQNQHQLSLLSQFQNVFAILIFLALDMHHIFLRAIVDSYQLLPPGGLNFSGGAIPFLMKLAGDMFVLGVKLSVPVLVVLLISGLALGLMARIFPQFNVFMFSFALNIILAFTVMGLTLNIVAALLGREFGALANHFHEMFQLL